ncbi:MAG: deoxyribodipyrimidine photo-lyase [Bacteroidota bacterium]
MTEQYTAFWFRRDLRLNDNHGLYQALTSGQPVLPVFIFDKHILDDLPETDARVSFIHQVLTNMNQQLVELGSSLVVRYGSPEEVWPSLIQDYSISKVITNHDYEPYARERDDQMHEWLSSEGIVFSTFQDQVIFEKEEILTNAGKAYSVFTPYSKKWKASLTQDRISAYPTEQHVSRFANLTPQPIPSLAEMGFQPSDIVFPGSEADPDVIKVYDQKRNFPAQPGTTRLGVHLRFGTISIRQLARDAMKLNETYLNELIWREFYMQILWNFPHVAKGPFRPQYGLIEWRNNEEDFRKWCDGKTGYPIVDAGMRELNATGYMHNRVRMIVASFLTKHLLINWQWGEAYFAEKLLDFELASNNGGWQWAAGSGTDAAPYFRVFNPESQMKKFDPELKYVRRWVPEFGTPAYPQPMVDHKMARQRCLDTYQIALKGKGQSGKA